MYDIFIAKFWRTETVESYVWRHNIFIGKFLIQEISKDGQQPGYRSQMERPYHVMLAATQTPEI